MQYSTVYILSAPPPPSYVLKLQYSSTILNCHHNMYWNYSSTVLCSNRCLPGERIALTTGTGDSVLDPLFLAMLVSRLYSWNIFLVGIRHVEFWSTVQYSVFCFYFEKEQLQYNTIQCPAFVNRQQCWTDRSVSRSCPSFYCNPTPGHSILAFAIVFAFGLRRLCGWFHNPWIIEVYCADSLILLQCVYAVRIWTISVLLQNLPPTWLWFYPTQLQRCPLQYCTAQQQYCTAKLRSETMSYTMPCCLKTQTGSETNLNPFIEAPRNYHRLVPHLLSDELCGSKLPGPGPQHIHVHILCWE